MNRTSDLLSSQWQNPADTLSVLLIIGGDVIQKALAQVSGDFLAPVAFSFGWVAYSFSTLMSVAGDGRLMPAPDHPVKVINGENGYCRENRSWILGRLFRDHVSPLDDSIGLQITVFKALKADKPEKDLHWASGLLTALVQLGIAAIPWGLYKDWGIFGVTACGTVLALLTGALPQWRFEKWACRKNTKKTLIVTGGNGTRFAMVIIGDGKGLDLEDLAAAESPRMRRRGECSNRLMRRDCDANGNSKKDAKGVSQKEVWMTGAVPLSFRLTQVACLTLATMWILLLITVAGLKENTWYLLLIGGLGMIQNVAVAGATRRIGTTGIHLEIVKKFEEGKVMDALMDLESEHENVGKSLLEEFFPGKLRPEELKWWNGDKTEYEYGRKLRQPLNPE